MVDDNNCKEEITFTSACAQEMAKDYEEANTTSVSKESEVIKSGKPTGIMEPMDLYIGGGEKEEKADAEQDTANWT